MTTNQHDVRTTPGGPRSEDYRTTAERYYPETGMATDYFDRYSSPWRDRIHWGPIVGGTVTAITSLMILSLLGLAFGLTTINAGTAAAEGSIPPDAARNAAMWGVVSAIISFFLGGYVAGRSVGTFNKGWGAMHGALVFMLGVPIVLWMAGMGLGSMVGGLAAFADDFANQVQGNTQISPAEVARTASEARNAAWTALVGVLLSLVAASFGGAMGTRNEVTVESVAPDRASVDHPREEARR